LRIEPAPTPEEAAAIVAALETLREEETAEDTRSFSNRSRWRLAGLFGHAVPPQMKLEGSLWSYSSWEGMV
jgi:predicted DNA-binding transcriptional regulator YafY